MMLKINSLLLKVMDPLIGPSQSSKFYSFSVFGPSTTTNSIGLKSSANAPTSLVGGGEKVEYRGSNFQRN